MTQPRRRGLQIDDPLGTDQPQPPVGPPAGSNGPAAPAAANRRDDATDRLSEGRQRGERESHQPHETVAVGQSAAHTPQLAHRGVWRAWSGITGVGSFRLPHELLIELGDTARELGLPIGMIVTAAITELLDQPPERIAELVDRADDARIQGRRNARRRLGERTGS
jgi:hypothetical protein